MFTQGEITVRDDHKYPDGAVVVDGIDEREDSALKKSSQ